MRRFITPLLLILAAVPGVDAGEPADDIAALVDARLAERWEADGVEPAGPADDATFLRRVYLDIAGEIPPASAVRDFLADDSPDKRRRVTAELLDGPGYVTNFAAVLRAALLPEADSNPQVATLLPNFDAWLRDRLIEGTPYDEIARRLITAEFEGSGPAAGGMMTAPGGPSPVAFLQAKEAKPENLAAATSRTFLGVRMECAQCHDHPFDHWTQREFWELAAFYSGVERRGGGLLGPLRERADLRSIAVPDADLTVTAAFPGGGEPDWQYETRPRDVLARWVTSEENPYFAKAAVNRVWGHLFGRGLVDPVDDFGAANPASHPELLDELAAAFVDSGYDLKTLIAGLTASRGYQLSSRGVVVDGEPGPGQDDAELFARFTVRALDAGRLYDSLARATGRFEAFDPSAAAGGAIGGGMDAGGRAEFLRAFRDESENSLDRRTTILQALALMNGGLVADSVDLTRSRTFAAVADAPFLNDAERVEALYLASLSRFPTEVEGKRLEAYLHAAVYKSGALADIFWSLLNSSEFQTQH